MPRAEFDFPPEITPFSQATFKRGYDDLTKDKSRSSQGTILDCFHQGVLLLEQQNHHPEIWYGLPKPKEDENYTTDDISLTLEWDRQRMDPPYYYGATSSAVRIVVSNTGDITTQLSCSAENDLIDLSTYIKEHTDVVDPEKTIAGLSKLDLSSQLTFALYHATSIDNDHLLGDNMVGISYGDAIQIGE